MERVKVVNRFKGRVHLLDKDTGINVTFDRKGASKKISLDKLEEAMSKTGVRYFFESGMLEVVEDNALEILKKLGLEDEDAEEPQNIIILSDNQRKRLMTTAPIGELEEMLKVLSYEQLQELADYAIENKLTDYDRCALVKKYIGIDIISAINLARAAVEEN